MHSSTAFQDQDGALKTSELDELFSTSPGNPWATQKFPDTTLADDAGAVTLQGWLAQHAIEPLYIDPGCPWQNGKDERFNGTVRDECLNMQLFGSLFEARIYLEAFRQHYNTERPHSALGYQTPLAFKQAWNEAQKKQQDSLIST